MIKRDYFISIKIFYDSTGTKYRYADFCFSLKTFFKENSTSVIEKATNAALNDLGVKSDDVYGIQILAFNRI